MAPQERARGATTSQGVLLAVAWLATPLAAVAPGALLLALSESRHPQVAGIALMLAGVVAVVGAVGWALDRSALSLGASVVVVLLCLVAQISLGLDDLFYGSWLFTGGAACLLAGLAGALTFLASRRGGEIAQQ